MNEQSAGASELGERGRAILDFEREWGARRADKSAAIRAQFGHGSARYYQELFALIDTPEALRFDPLLVRRLQRLRDDRTRDRIARTLGPHPGPRSQDD